jgi:hypothetical protein
MPSENQTGSAQEPGVWKSFVLWPYSILILVVVCLIPIYVFLVPGHYYAEKNNVRALVLAFLCGGAVGMTEISSRYRDEQMKAILSPDGLLYILCNGAISTFALILIFHFSITLTAFTALKGNPLTSAIAAGFGATAIMRTRFAVIKGADNKDISIGPDIVINLLLAMIDRRIDRWRAARRQEIITDHFDKLKALGTVEEAGKYLLASLVSFQNLSEPEKKEFAAMIKANEKGDSENIQLATMGYLFLTVVGEENFDSVLEKAKDIRGRGTLPPLPPPPAVAPPPVPPPAAPPPVPPGAAPPP